jgi:hypothetical protein
MDEVQEIESQTTHGPNGKPLESMVPPSSESSRGTGRSFVQNVYGIFEVPDDPALIRFRDPPKTPASEIVIERLRAENKMLADVRALLQHELKRIKSEPAQAEPKALQKREAAQRLSISVKKLHALRDRGEIDVIRNGTAPQLFPVASLDEWLRDNAERF